jgi:hypothetical protein
VVAGMVSRRMVGILVALRRRRIALNKDGFIRVQAASGAGWMKSVLISTC